MGYLSGKTGYVALGSTPYSFGKWKCSIKSGLPKVTNFKSQGFQALVAGILSSTITLSGPYEVGAMPLVAGQAYEFHLGLDVGIELVVTARIETLEPDNDVEGAPAVSVTAQSTGPFTAAIS